MTTATIAGPHDTLQTQARWRWAEIAFWLATLLPFVPAALFTVPLDVVLRKLSGFFI